MQINTKVKSEYTHEGAKAFRLTSPELKLRRSVMSCLLWESEFYEDGESIAERISSLADQVSSQCLSDLIIEVRTKYYLRHVPLLLLLSLIKKNDSKLIADTIYNTIQRPDELSELLALYWKDGKKPIDNQLKKGLAKAFTKFDAYSLAKYNRDKEIKLRDVMFLVHPKAKNEEQAITFKKLANNELESPDTWEVNLSKGADKKETFERLLKENKLGYLALLRNLRNMIQSNVDDDLIRQAILKTENIKMILPFRFIAAARHAPNFENELDIAMMHSINELPELSGLTVVLVDVSGSMTQKLSQKSDMTRMDAAAGLASIIKSEKLRVFSFSNKLVEVPSNRRGMSGVDAVIHSQDYCGTDLIGALNNLYKIIPEMDRLIVISDEQISIDISNSNTLPLPNGKPYMINVASYKNGVGYGKWIHIDGFSENVIKYIYELENCENTIDGFNID